MAADYCVAPWLLRCCGPVRNLPSNAGTVCGTPVAGLASRITAGKAGEMEAAPTEPSSNRLDNRTPAMDSIPLKFYCIAECAVSPQTSTGTPPASTTQRRQRFKDTSEGLAVEPGPEGGLMPIEQAVGNCSPRHALWRQRQRV